MTATLVTHRCPLCGHEVLVFAKDATAWHLCPHRNGKPQQLKAVVPGKVAS